MGQSVGRAYIRLKFLNVRWRTERVGRNADNVTMTDSRAKAIVQNVSQRADNKSVGYIDVFRSDEEGK